MKQFFDDYFNIKKIRSEKKEYKAMMERVKALPEDYQYVFKKIQSHMWMFTSGAGYDMMHIHQDVLELFEQGALEGKNVLEVTGDDVSAFCEELLKNASTYTEDWRTKLNKDIHKKVKK